jgi:ketosteroid isomerase-like protein
VAVATKPAPPTPAAAAVNVPTPQPTAPVATKAPVQIVTPPATDSAANAQTKEVEAAVGSWASAWSARDVKAYLAAYGKDFDPPGSMGRKAWEEERTQRILGKASISVKLDKLVVSVNGNHAQAKFRQDYKAGGLAVSSHKTLELSKVNDHWHIVKETVVN